MRETKNEESGLKSAAWLVLHWAFLFSTVGALIGGILFFRNEQPVFGIGLIVLMLLLAFVTVKIGQTRNELMYGGNQGESPE